MEDLKITVEIKNSNGNGVGFEYDLDVVHPYLDGLLQLLSEIQTEQERKAETKMFDDMFAKIRGELGKKEANEVLDKIIREVEYAFNSNQPKHDNKFKRYSKGRFTKTNPKKK